MKTQLSNLCRKSLLITAICITVSIPVAVHWYHIQSESQLMVNRALSDRGVRASVCGMNRETISEMLGAPDNTANGNRKWRYFEVINYRKWYRDQYSRDILVIEFDERDIAIDVYATD